MSAASRPSPPLPPPPPSPPPPQPLPRTIGGAWQHFWNRITDGLAVDQLWSQFQTEARTSYRLYAKDLKPWDRAYTPRPMHQFWYTVSQFFWAILLKLSPPRRVLLIASLVMILIGPVVVKDSQGKDSFHIELAAIGTIGVLLVLVLEVADRVTMKRDLQIAREIQGWLEPKETPATPQLDIGFTTRPANTVAGDYYDAFPRAANAPPGTEPPLLLIVADVAGKSIPAAMLMATLHASLHTLARHPGPLLEVVTGLNGYCCEHSNGGSRFTTAFVAEYDPATRTLTSVNAGHNQPVLLRASGAIERLDQGGIPLGIMPEFAYAAATHTLAPGDVLFIFTDGLVEAENSRQQEFGEGPLLPLLIANRGLQSTEIITSVMRQVEGFVGDTPQHDDITCMAVRVK